MEEYSYQEVYKALFRWSLLQDLDMMGLGYEKEDAETRVTCNHHTEHLETLFILRMDLDRVFNRLSRQEREFILDVSQLGFAGVAKDCGVSRQAIHKRFKKLALKTFRGLTNE